MFELKESTGTDLTKDEMQKLYYERELKIQTDAHAKKIEERHEFAKQLFTKFKGSFVSAFGSTEMSSAELAAINAVLQESSDGGIAAIKTEFDCGASFAAVSLLVFLILICLCFKNSVDSIVFLLFLSIY